MCTRFIWIEMGFSGGCIMNTVNLWFQIPSCFRFLDHTQRRTTVGRAPLDEWSARRRDLYQTTHNTHNRQTSIPPGEIRTHNSSMQAAKHYALDCTATGTGRFPYNSGEFLVWAQWVISKNSMARAQHTKTINQSQVLKVGDSSNRWSEHRTSRAITGWSTRQSIKHTPATCRPLR